MPTWVSILHPLQKFLSGGVSAWMREVLFEPGVQLRPGDGDEVGIICAVPTLLLYCVKQLIKIAVWSDTPTSVSDRVRNRVQKLSCLLRTWFEVLLQSGTPLLESVGRRYERDFLFWANRRVIPFESVTSQHLREITDHWTTRVSVRVRTHSRHKGSHDMKDDKVVFDLLGGRTCSLANGLRIEYAGTV